MTDPNILAQETNVRFWHQTGYKPLQALDPTNPTDRKMASVWMDIWARVNAEDAAGVLVLTHQPTPRAPRAPSTSIQGHSAYVGEESPSPPPEDQKHAATLAQRMHENFVGVVLNSGVLGKWEVRGFPSKEMLEDWYGKIAYKKPADYDYVAAFDKNRYGAKPYGSSWSPSRARKKTLSRGLIIGGVVVGGALLARSFLVPSRARGNGSR